MSKHLTFAFALFAWLVWPAPQVVAEEPATPQEVIAKVREAAAYLQKHGKPGLEDFQKADSPFVFKDTYVFVFDCGAGQADIAHPAADSKVTKVTSLEGATGKMIGPDLCRAAARPSGGWVEYMWWKPVKAEGAKQLDYAREVSRKVTYMLSVEGQPYQVGAGVHNDTATAAELDAMLKN